MGFAPIQPFNNPKILEPLATFDLVDPLTIASQDFYADSGDTDLPTPTDLMARLADMSSHYGVDTVFLSNNGAEVVQNVLRIDYDGTGADTGLRSQASSTAGRSRPNS